MFRTSKVYCNNCTWLSESHGMGSYSEWVECMEPSNKGFEQSYVGLEAMRPKTYIPKGKVSPFDRNKDNNCTDYKKKWWRLLV